MPLLLLAPIDWPAALCGDHAGVPLIFDLHPEDGNEPSPEDDRALLAFLQARDRTIARRPVLVRIGGFPDANAETDLATLGHGLPDGILLSGCRNGADIQKLDVLLGVAEAAANRPIGETSILAECGAEAQFFLSPHSLARKSARLRGLVFNAAALAGATGAMPDYPRIRPAGGLLSFARAICVLKAVEAQVPRYEMLAATIAPDELMPVRTASLKNGFDDIVASGPAHLAALSGWPLRP
ncbi:hypothetical protein [Pararhizobium antarcticum]|uniref:HpcH/HpaI aldolase/citrate lyase domain-containing protein n=1 Tax=Pararhizobium antarcticum TaxID=1798805 RepID=A0A657LPA5_9HYPH|nr:hypothetical protein [Pararhizobium antarcticum]OJF89912.1 hypothetical protein AX761_23880 [Rhizobium sp. 58]OJF93718.1 hypothetical protein AX760_21365 [Pararhizobium antarcticum]